MKRETTVRYLETMKMQETLELTLSQIEAVLPEKKFFSAVREKFLTSMQGEEILSVFDNMFNEEEAEYLIAVYSSPTGRAVMAKMPAAIAAISEAIDTSIGKIVDDLTEGTT